MHVKDIQIARWTVLCQMEPTTVNLYGERRVLITISMKMVNFFLLKKCVLYDMGNFVIFQFKVTSYVKH